VTARTADERVAEVMVIGGGLAGAVAALAARAAGAQVLLVRRAPGASALSGGAIGVAPDLGALPDDPLRTRRSPLESARRLAARWPGHPYARLGLEALEEALAFTAAELSALLEPPDGRPRFLAHASGAVAECALCQRSQAPGDLRRLEGRIAVAGFAGHLGWDARLVSAGVNRLRAAGGPEAAALDVDWPRGPDGGALSPAGLARALEPPGAAEALGAALKRALPDQAALERPARIAVVLLPPVLGIDPAARVPERVAAAAGLPVAELISDPPSVPGLRLDAALLSRLRGAGVEVVEGSLQPGGGPGRPAAVEEAGVGAARSLLAPAWVLASGRFIGGGLVRTGALAEPLLGLPVRAAAPGAPGAEPPDRSPASLTARVRSAPQPLLAAGVLVDREGRPLGEGGQPLHPRLYAAGAIIGGHEHASDGTGLGVAILSGFLAGRRAAR